MNSCANYILSVGTTGSGEPAFKEQLIRYLREGGKNFEIEAGEGSFRVQPIRKYKGKPALEFGFLEHPSEDLMEPGANEQAPKPVFGESLSGFLRDPGLKFVFVFVCEANPADQDALFLAVVNHLRSNFSEEAERPFSSRCPILFIAPKVLSERGEGEDESLEEQAVPPIARHLPQTFAALQAWEASYALAEYDLGASKQNGEKFQRDSFEEMAKIFRWIYFQFNREMLADPFISRLWKSLRKSVP